jgi:hypothetical protein
VSQPPDHAPHDGEPGSASVPGENAGDSPVTLEDRTEPGGQGSPGANQAKAEPTVPATTEHPAPAKAFTSPGTRSIDDMNVGSADPQAPRHPAAAGSGLAVEDVAPGSGSMAPVQDPAGTAHRAPGLQGRTPSGELIGTDLEAGAARMGPAASDTTDTPDAGKGQGDAATVPASGSQPSPGTSEEHAVVHGVRLPDATES